MASVINYLLTTIAESAVGTCRATERNTVLVYPPPTLLQGAGVFLPGDGTISALLNWWVGVKVACVMPLMRLKFQPT